MEFIFYLRYAIGGLLLLFAAFLVIAETGSFFFSGRKGDVNADGQPTGYSFSPGVILTSLIAPAGLALIPVDEINDYWWLGFAMNGLLFILIISAILFPFLFVWEKISKPKN